MVTECKAPDLCGVTAGNNRHRRCGFTFTEIVVVMAIAGILAATALPSVFPGGMTARRAAHVIASDINFTRVEAMSKSRPFSLSSTTPYSYGYGSGQIRDLRKLGGSLSLDQALNITFNSLGEPLGITVPLTIDVTDSLETVSITIAPYIGRVSVLP